MAAGWNLIPSVHLSQRRAAIWAVLPPRGNLIASGMFLVVKMGVERGGLLLASRASLVAQMVTNLPAVQQTQVQFLDREDPLEEEMTIHSSIPVWGIPMNRGAWWAIVHGVTKRHD